MFSFVPRCQGWCGSQKDTGIDRAAVMWACSAISRPRSQVNDRRRDAGSRPMCSITAWATTSALYPSGSATTIVERVARCTSVTTADGRVPKTRSPSVSGDLAVVGLGGSFVGGHHVADPAAPV